MAAALPKPFSENEIIHVISGILGKEHTALNPTETTVVDTALYDLSNLETIAQGNTAFVRKMIDLFLDQTPPMLVQMNEAFLQNDLSTVSGLAHKMKPSLDNLGIISLKEVIRIIEKAGKSGISDQQLKDHLDILEVTLGKVFQDLKKEQLN